MIREMSKLAITWYDITDRIDMLHIRTSIIIRDDASFIWDDSRFFQLQTTHIWHTTECKQDMREGYFLSLLISFSSRSEDELTPLSSIDTSMVADIDSGSLESRSECECEVVVLSSRAKPISTYEHCHSRPLPSKCERHLDPNESSSYDDELLDILLIEYRTVREYQLTRYSLDRHSPRIWSCRDDDMTGSIRLPCHFDSMRVYESRISHDYLESRIASEHLITRLFMTKYISDTPRMFEWLTDISVCMDECLRWDTPIVRTVSADESSLDHEDFFPYSCETESDSESSWSSSDNDDIESILHNDD